MNAHITASVLLGIEQLRLEEPEAKNLGDAIKEVCRHYPVAFNPKYVALANLVITAGGIYGSRFMAYNLERSLNRKPASPKLVNIDNQQAKPKTNGFPAPPQYDASKTQAPPSAVFPELFNSEEPEQ